MKKNYLFLAAATTLFAACVQTDVVTDIPEPQQQAISFETFVDKATRAEIANVSNLQSDNGGFHVWGYKNREREDEYTVFNNVPVSWVAASGEVSAHWGYSDPQYWDQTATYKFYAVAPKAPTAVTYAIGDGTDTSNPKWEQYKIKITGAKSGKSTEVTDYLIDRDGVTGVVGSKKQPVCFEFNHIMAKLSFKFKAGVDENITITSLKMTGWDNGTGTFTQRVTTVPSTVTNTEWNIATTNIANGDECVIINNTNSVSGVNSTSAVTGGYSYIMVPQTITYVAPVAANGTTAAVAESGLTFTISYTIIHGEVDGTQAAFNAPNDPKDEVFLNQVGILPATQVWGTDTHTTYTIIVSPDKIEFGNPTIKDWSVTDTDGDGDNSKNTDNTLPL